MLLVTIFLITLSIMFSSGKKSPEFFGSHLYLVKSDAFEPLIHAPSAIFGEKAHPVMLRALSIDDIVIFRIFNTDDNKAKSRTLIGKITEREQEDDDILHFIISGERGESYTVSEHDIIAKATRASRTLGLLINFAVSPAGVLVIAVIPCLCIIFAELLKPFFRKSLDRKQVVPVNKQIETPTFVPVSEPPVLFPTSPGLTDSEIREEDLPAEKPVNPAAALKAYKQTLALDEIGTGSEKEIKQPQLFVLPEKPRHYEFEPKPQPNPEPNPNKPKPESPLPPSPLVTSPIATSSPATVPIKPPHPVPPVQQKKKPLSSVKLAEVIASVNAQRSGNAKNSPKSESASADVAKNNDRVNQIIAAYSKQINVKESKFE